MYNHQAYGICWGCILIAGIRGSGILPPLPTCIPTTSWSGVVGTWLVDGVYCGWLLCALFFVIAFSQWWILVEGGQVHKLGVWGGLWFAVLKKNLGFGVWGLALWFGFSVCSLGFGVAIWGH